MILANIIAFIASMVMVYSGILNNKRKILFVQGVEIILFIISDILVLGYSGAIINFLSLVRNIIVYRGKLNNMTKAILLLLSTGLTLFFNNLGFIGLLPLFSMYIYVLFMNTEDIIKFKILMISSLLLWGVYDMMISLYTSLAFDILTILSCLVTLLMLDRGAVWKK